ncbi:MAG: response regulator transcription factor [Firmicutes bacterium]|nr:response regulator transcription factor [Bacillota bacterium]
MTTILVAEDDPSAQRLLTKFLTAKGYRALAAADGREAIHAFFAHDPDLVLLDVNMPAIDGWGVLREIRAVSSVPVIMLTIRNSTDDKVRGLTEGADDYVTKPFDLKEIDARIRAVLRRARGRKEQAVLSAGPLVVDDEAKEVRLRGRLIVLSPKEYELLRLLASRPGRVFSTQEILQAVWPERAYEGSAEDVKKYIYFLRNKLESDGEGPGLIQTVRGFGYKLVAD